MAKNRTEDQFYGGSDSTPPGPRLSPEDLGGARFRPIAENAGHPDAPRLSPEDQGAIAKERVFHTNAPPRFLSQEDKLSIAGYRPQQATATTFERLNPAQTLRVGHPESFYAGDHVRMAMGLEQQRRLIENIGADGSGMRYINPDLITTFPSLTFGILKNGNRSHLVNDALNPSPTYLKYLQYVNDVGDAYNVQRMQNQADSYEQRIRKYQVDNIVPKTVKSEVDSILTQQVARLVPEQPDTFYGQGQTPPSADQIKALRHDVRQKLNVLRPELAAKVQEKVLAEVNTQIAAHMEDVQTLVNARLTSLNTGQPMEVYIGHQLVEVSRDRMIIRTDHLEDPKSKYAAALALALNPKEQVMFRDPGAKGDAIQAITSAEKVAMTAVSLPFLPIHYLGEEIGKIPYGIGKYFPATAVPYWSIKGFEKGLGMGTEGLSASVGKGYANLLGLADDSPGRAGVQQAAGDLLLLMALVGVGEGLSAFKEGRWAFPEEYFSEHPELRQADVMQVQATHGWLGQHIYDMARSDTWAQYGERRSVKSFATNLKKIVDRYPDTATSMITRMTQGRVPVALSDLLVKGVKADIPIEVTIEEYVKQASQGSYKSARLRLDDVNEQLLAQQPLDPPKLEDVAQAVNPEDVPDPHIFLENRAKMNSLLAEKYTLEQKLASVPQEPIAEMPHRRWVGDPVRRIMFHSAITPTEKGLTALFNSDIWGGKLSLSRFFDDAQTVPTVYAPGAPHRPDALTDNVLTVGKYLEQARVPRPVLNTLLEKWSRLNEADQPAFFDLVKETAEAIGTSIYPEDAAAAQAIANVWLKKANNSERFGYKKTVETPDGTEEAWFDAAKSASGAPGVIFDAELTHQANLPSLNHIRAARSLTKRTIESIRKRGGAYAALVKPYDLGRWLLNAGTAILKPTALLGFGLRVPELMFRIIGDQLLREGVTQGALPGRIPGDVAKWMEKDPDGLYSHTLRQELGSGFNEESQGGSSYERHYIDPSRPLDAKAVKYLSDRMRSVYASENARFLLRFGKDKFVKWITGDSETGIRARQRWEAALKREYPDLTLAEAAAKRADVMLKVIDNLSGGNEDIIHAMRSGNVERFLQRDEKLDSKSGLPITQELGRVTSDINLNKRYIEQAIETQQEMELPALLEEQTRLRHQMENLEKQLGDVRHGGRIEEGGHLERLLREEQEAGRYTPPDRIHGKDFNHSMSPRFDDTFYGQMIEYEGLQRVSNWLYKPMKIISKADELVSRGPTFKKRMGIEYNRMISMGLDKATALDYARVRAASWTKGLHYDVSDRSSFDRMAKHVFWFSQVSRELFGTWFIRIPHEAYWPVGMALLLKEKDQLERMLTDFGIMKREPSFEDQPGKKYLTIPGFDPKTFNIGLDWAPLDPTGLGTQTGVGSFIPKASPLFTVPTAILAKQHGGIFKTLSEMFSFNGPFGSAYVGGGLEQMFQYITGKPAPWAGMTGPAQAMIMNAAKLKAEQIAASDLASKGIFPPNPLDYEQTKLPDGTTVLSEKGQADLEAARDDYRKRLNFATKDYQRGVELAALLRSLSPIHLTLHDPEYEAYNTAMKPYYDKIDAAPADINDPAHQAASQALLVAQANYVKKHPEAFPFTVSKTVAGQGVAGPLEETPQNSYVRSFDYGLRDVKDPELFTQAILSRRTLSLLQEQLDYQLHKANPQGDKNPVQYLLNSTEYGKAWKNYYEGRAELDTLYPELALHNQQLRDESQYMNKLGELQGNLADIEKWAEKGQIEGAPNLSKLHDQLQALAPPKTNPTLRDKVVAWYFGKVEDKYWTQLGGMYKKAAALKASGDTAAASDVYNNIRVYKNAASKRGYTYQGYKFPSPEEYSWLKMDDNEREDRLVNWASTPLSFRTDFELKKLGLDPKKTNKALDFFRRIDDAVNTSIRQHGYVYTDTAYNKLKDWGDNQKIAFANKNGLQNIWQMENGAPASRMVSLKITNNGTFIDFTSRAEEISKRVEHAGFSASGWGKMATDYKRWFFSQVTEFRQHDKSFNRVMNQAEEQYQESGARLYDHIFFNDFYGGAIPYEIVRQTR